VDQFTSSSIDFFFKPRLLPDWVKIRIMTKKNHTGNPNQFSIGPSKICFLPEKIYNIHEGHSERNDTRLESFKRMLPLCSEHAG
jgi:hypothetical protein